MAKKVIANLNIQLSATSATLKQEFDKVGGAVRKLNDQVAGSGKGLERLAGAKTAAANAAGNLAAMVKTAVVGVAALTVAATLAQAGLRGIVDRFAEIDEAQETAARMGTTADALLAIRHAAKMTGSDVEAVDRGLGLLLRKLGDASAGGASAKVFESLGLSVAELQRMRPEEMLATVADQIAALPTAAERARAAFAVFGKQGEGILNLLAAGGDEIRKYADEADKLGLTLGAIDSSKIAATNDEWDRAKAAFTGVANQLAVAVAPAAERVAQKLTRFGVALGNVIESNRPLLEAFGLAVANTFGKVVDWISAMLEAWDRWVRRIEDAARNLAQLGDLIGRTLSFDVGGIVDGKPLGAEWEERQKAAEAEAAAQAERAKAAADAADEFARQQEAAEAAAEAIAAVEAEHAKVAASVRSTPSIGAAVRGTAGGFDAVQSGQTAMRDVREALKRSAESDKRREALQEAMADALRKMAEASGTPKINVRKVTL